MSPPKSRSSWSRPLLHPLPHGPSHQSPCVFRDPERKSSVSGNGQDTEEKRQETVWGVGRPCVEAMLESKRYERKRVEAAP